MSDKARARFVRTAPFSVSKNFQFTPVSCIIEETGV